MTPPVWNFADGPELFAAFSARMIEAVTNRHAAWHLLTLATIGIDGRPQARTVVLRGFDPEQRTIRIHTDRRSPKVAEIERDRRVQLHGYDATSRCQLRVAATAELHVGDAVARSAWDASQPMSRLCYGAAIGPSRPWTGEGDPPVPRPDDFDEATAFGNFVAVTCHFESLELLELHADGHRRARLNWQSVWRSERLAP